jgi:TonB family protein
VVTVLHVLAVILIGVMANRGGCRPEPQEEILPVDFIMEAPAAAAVENNSVTAPPAPPDEPPPPEPRIRKPIEVSRELIKRDHTPTASPRKVPTAEEIRQAMSIRGVEPTIETTAPAEAAYYDLIRRILYRAWHQPGALHGQGLASRVKIGLHRNGSIHSRKLIGASGNEVMDNSVMSAVNSVSRIPGLSPGFLTRHPTVTITFRLVTEEGVL